MKIVVLSFKIVPVRPPGRGHLSSARPPVRPSARAGAGRTYIHKTPDRPPWAAVTRTNQDLQTPWAVRIFILAVLSFCLDSWLPQIASSDGRTFTFPPDPSPNAPKDQIRRKEPGALAAMNSVTS